MPKLPVKHEPRTSRVIDAEPFDVLEAPIRRSGAFSFSYSYTEISAVGGKAHVKSRRARYEDGKLSKESFDGEFDRGVYDNAVADMQRAFAAQTSTMLRAFTSLFALPFAGRRDRD